jgi:hypothetical protein
MPYIHVDASEMLEELDDDEIIAECESRGFTVGEINYDKNELLLAIYEKRRLGKDYQTELDNLIYEELGRIL